MDDPNHISERQEWRRHAAAELRDKQRVLIGNKETVSRQIEKLVQQVEGGQNLVKKIEVELRDLVTGARVLGIELDENGAQDGAGKISAKNPEGPILGEEDNAQAGQFKDRALEILRGIYPRSLRAPDLQVAVEAHLGRKFHPKTAGMTLYRFRNQKMVRREGRNWFYVPQTVAEHAGSDSVPDASHQETKEDVDER